MTEGTREQGRGVSGRSRRAAAWLGWTLFGLSIVLTAAAGLLTYLGYSVQGTSESAGAGVTFGLAMLMYPLVGALLVSRRPKNPIGWMFCVIGVFAALNAVSAEYTTYATMARPDPLPMAAYMAWLANWAWVPSGLLVIILPLLFPHGRLPSRRWRPALWLAIAIMTALILNRAFVPGPFEDYPSLRNPFGIEGAEGLLRALYEANTLLLLMVSLAVAALVARFRRSRGDERQQLKWFVYAVAVMAAILAATFIAGALLNKEPVDIAYVPMLASMATLPVAVGIAILKYRLYDIDLLINRTLVYGSLTAALVVVYVGSVVVLQYAFRALTGQESQLAVVASTLAIAALFNPLRRRLQGFVDRRFYRRKYDARKTLEAFSAKLRDETDLEALNNELVGVVRETMQPTHVSLWLRPDTASKKDEAPG